MIKRNKVIAVAVSTLLILSGCANNSNSKKEDSKVERSNDIKPQRITAEEAKEKIDSGGNLIILDVREVSEYDEGHIKNSVLLPVGAIESNIDKVITKAENKENPILIYCRSGNRSAQAAKALVELGYTNVYDFGGIMDWPYDVVK